MDKPVVSNTRKELIEDLRLIVNNREDESLTFEQVEIYVGSDISDDALRTLVDETDEEINPVNAGDILGCCS